MTSCCSSRWSLACVQKAADYALTLHAGDVCGRYAWAQGPIANTQQYYPRDFSLFTWGDATGLVRVPTKCSAGTLGNPNNRSLATVKANACATGAKYAKTPRADEDYVNYVRGSAGRAFRRAVMKGGRWR